MIRVGGRKSKQNEENASSYVFALLVFEKYGNEVKQTKREFHFVGGLQIERIERIR